MDLLSCLLDSVQCLETTLRNKSVGETTFRSGLAISEEWNGLLSNLTRTPLWTSGQCQKPIRKIANNKEIISTRRLHQIQSTHVLDEKETMILNRLQDNT